MGHPGPERFVRTRSNSLKPSGDPARTLGIGVSRKFSILNNRSHVDRLRDQIKELRGRAGGLPPGDERDELLRKAQQDEIALCLIEWVTSSDQQPPPENLIPIRRHLLRRK